MDPSSISGAPVEIKGGEISCESSGVCGFLNEILELPADLHRSPERDHNPVGSDAALFKESIRRQDIIGRKIACVLQSASLSQFLKGTPGGEEDSHPRQELKLDLNEHADAVSTMEPANLGNAWINPPELRAGKTVVQFDKRTLERSRPLHLVGWSARDSACQDILLDTLAHWLR